MTTRVHDAITATVAALQAGTTASLAAVVDGPFLTGEDPTSAVYVGYDGDPEGDFNATENWSQDWAGLGAQRKNESFDIVGCVISWSGDVTVADRRATALAVLGAVESDLRAAANIGLGLPQPTTVMWASGQLFQEQGPRGLQARIPFSISVRTRI